MSRGLNRVKRGLAVLLSACMIFGMTPIQAWAEETVSGNTLQTESTEQDVKEGENTEDIEQQEEENADNPEGEKEESSPKINRNRIVTAFAALDGSVMYQQLAIGASEEEITFPDELTVTVQIQTKAGSADGEADTDNAESTDAAEGAETSAELSGITWNLDKEESDAEEFDASEAADGFCYVYTPVLPDTDKDGNTLVVGDDVELPAIYVLVGEPQLALLAEEEVAEVTVGSDTKTYATVNDAIAAIQTAIKDNASGGTLDIGLTFLADQAVTGLNSTLNGEGKTNLTINMNGQKVGINWDNNASTKDFSLSMENIKTTLTGSGKLSATVVIGGNAELTVKDESNIEYQGTLTIKDGGTANLKNWDGNGSVPGNIVIESGSCTITGGTYGQIDVEFGAKLEVSGDTAEIASLYAYPPEIGNSTVKRAEIKLLGGTYNTIELADGFGSSYLVDSNYGCAIVDMLASGYRFYDSQDTKTVKTPERTATELTDVKVLTEPEVIVSFQITNTVGTTQRKDFSTWNEAMSYLSDSDNETEFAEWEKVEILLKKDAPISVGVDQISDKLSAELVLCSDGDTPHTLSGTHSFSCIIALHTNGQKLTVENIKTNGASITAVDGTVTIKAGADLTASGSNARGTIDVIGSTLILENGASVTSNYISESEHKWPVAILMTDVGTGTLRIQRGAMIKGRVSNYANEDGSVVVIEEGAELPTIEYYEYNGDNNAYVYCNLDSTTSDAWAAMKGGSVYFPIDCNGVTLTIPTDGAIKEYDGKIYGRYKTDNSSKIQVPDTVCSYQHAGGTTTSADGGYTFTMSPVDGTITPVDADHTFTMPPAKVKLLKHTPDTSGSCPNCGKTDLEKAYADRKLQINGLTGRTYDSWPQILTSITLTGADGKAKTLKGPKYNDDRELAQDSTDAANADLTGADYAVVYENNIKAYDKKKGASGFDAAKAPKVTIIGQGAYTGTIEYYFTIGQGKLQMAGFVARQSVYNGPQDALQQYGTLTYEADETDAAAQVPNTGLSDTSIPVCTGKTVEADGFASVDALKLEYSTDQGRIWTEIRQSSEDTSKASYQITDAGTYPFLIRATDANVSAPASQSLTATIEKRDMTTEYNGTRVEFIWLDEWGSVSPDSMKKRIFYCTGEPIVPDVYLVVRDYIGGRRIDLEKDKDYIIYATDNTNPGSAYLIVEGIGNYTGNQSELFSIEYAFKLKQTNASSGHWYNKDVPVVFGVNNTTGTSEEDLRQILYRSDTKATGVGDNIKPYPTLQDAIDGTNEGYTYTEEGINSETFYCKDPATGYIGRAEQIWIQIDKTAPTWADKDGNTENYGIQVKENWWRKLLNTISFGMLYNDATLDIKIRANDKKNGLQDSRVSGIDKYYYYVDTVADAADKTAAKTKAELDALAEQNMFTAADLDSGLFGGEGATISGKLPSDGKYVVYAYAVDKAGNKSDYICTEGMVLDTTAPELTVTAPVQEEGTLKDTTATITVQTDEDATLMYIYTYTARRNMNGELTYEEAADRVEAYMQQKGTDKKKPPFAKQENGKWIPDVIYQSLSGMGGTMNLDPDVATTVAVVPGGCQELKAGEKSTFTLKGLPYSTQTKVWLVAIDKAGNITDTETLEFKTTKQMPKITTLPQLSGVYGDTVDKLTLTPGAAKYYNDVDIVGTWNVVSTDFEKPEVGTTMQYTVKFRPYDTALAEAYVKVTPTIAKRPINIRVADMTKGYQESVPKLTFEIPTTADGKTQLADGDTEDTIQSSLHLVTEAEAGSDAGAYPFTVTSDSKNYEVTATYVENLSDQTKPSKSQGTLTITKAQGELKKEADYQDDRKVTFGDAAFSLDVTPNHTESKIQYQVIDEKDADGGHILSVSADGKVTIKGAGSAKIQISLPESKNYTAPTPLTVNVTVARKVYVVLKQSRSYLYDRESADTIDLAALLPKDCGSAAYSIIGTVPDVFETAQVTQDGKLSYKVKNGSIGDSGTIKVQVTTDNYTINGNAGGSGEITVKAELVDRKPVEASGTVSVENPTLTYGEPVSKLKFNPVTFVEPGTKKTVAGTLRWNTPDEKLSVGAQNVAWTFTPDNNEYQIVTGSLSITVQRAVPKVGKAPVPGAYVYHPTNALGSEEAKSLLNAGAKVQGVVTNAQGNAVDGSWSWKEQSEVPDAGTHTYTAVFTPTDAANYETVEKPVTLTVEKAYVSIRDTKAGLTIPTYKHGEYLYNQELPDTGKACYAGKGESYDSDVVNGIEVPGKYVWAAPGTQVKYSDGVLLSSGKMAKYEVVEFMPDDTTNYAGTMETKNGWSSQKLVSVTLEKADNPPYRPSAQMTVASTCQTVSDVKLPKDWIWFNNADTPLTDNSSVLATAEYTGPDSDCYKNTFYEITITRSTCDHARTKVENAKPATCISEGSTGETWCTKCGEKLDDGCVLVKDATKHERLTETVVRQATTSQTGLKVQECSDCHYRKEVTIPKLSGGSTSQGGGSAQQPGTPDGNGQNTAGGSSDGSGASSTSGGNDGGQSTPPAQEKEKTQTPAQQPTDRGNAAGPANTNRNSVERTTDERSPETGEPFIRGENGKEGWNVIDDELKTVKEGETVSLVMNGTTIVPKNVIDGIKGKDVTLVLDMGNGISWKINGKDITEASGDIDLGVTVGKEAGKSISVDVINSLTGERSSMKLTLAYSGEFGFTATLTVNMESKNAGLYANLFYYNEQSGQPEFVSAGQIDADGNVELAFTHASDYIIVIDAAVMDSENEEAVTSAESTGDGEDGTIPDANADDARDYAWNPTIIIIIGICILLIVFGAVIYVRKKSNSEEE